MLRKRLRFHFRLVAGSAVVCALLAQAPLAFAGDTGAGGVSGPLSLNVRH